VWSHSQHASQGFSKILCKAHFSLCSTQMHPCIADLNNNAWPTHHTDTAKYPIYANRCDLQLQLHPTRLFKETIRTLNGH
jgi:hypothetical protein